MAQQVKVSAKMSVLNVYNLSMSFGERTLFDGVSFDVEEKDKIGFVGVNGVGKTTVFKMITGHLEPSGGEVFKSKTAVLGYMDQHSACNPQNTVYQELLTVFRPLQEMELELETLALQIENQKGDWQKLIQRQADLTEQFNRDGGLTYQSRTRSALLGLGFVPADLELTTDKLSGGQRSKLALAKLLLGGANFLLLDEPTNHLDITAVEWLEGFLRDFNGSALIVSHDRYFLDRVTNKTVELGNGKMISYKGNYSEFLKKKEKIQEDIREKYEEDQKEIRRIEEIVRQQRQWNKEKNIKTAESKLKQIERIKAQMVVPDREQETIRFDFTPRRVSGSEVLVCEDLSKSFGEKVLFRRLDFQINRGEKVFLLGGNGCGKTTLFKILTGAYASDEGRIRLGAQVDLGYFDQVQSNLHLEKTALQEVWDDFPAFTETRIRSALAAFLFKGDDIYKKLSACSGGERARVALLKLMLAGSNFLLLDEPTNHLDAFSRETLERTLLEYSGTMFIVSHDRYFINKIADRILVLTPNGLQEYRGDYDYYLEKSREAPAAVSARTEKKNAGGNDYQRRKAHQSALRKVNAQIARQEEAVQRTEEEARRLEEEIGEPEVAADYERLMECTNQLEEVHRRQEKLYQEWETLQEELARLEEEGV